MKTPEQYIKQDILLMAIENKYSDIAITEVPDDKISELFDQYSSALQDDIYEYRQGWVNTDINSPYSRNYESNSVAKQMHDGTWVGWTHWYGGGKHGQPESIPWMNEAYFLDCKEEEKVVVIQTFTVKEK